MNNSILKRAFKDSFLKMNPKVQLENPVMFLVYLSAIAVSVLWVLSFAGFDPQSRGYTFTIAVILWLTCLFSNFAEAIAEGRGKPRRIHCAVRKKEIEASKIASIETMDVIETISSSDLKKGDLVIVKAGELIPADGDVVFGAASVDESAITGESAPVIREAGGDRCAVTGGTRVLSDQIVVVITATAGDGFLDRMIAMVEGASAKNTK